MNPSRNVIGIKFKVEVLMFKKDFHISLREKKTNINDWTNVSHFKLSTKG